jgi:hypothetical protein
MMLQLAIAVSLVSDIGGAAKPVCTWRTKPIPRILASQLSVEQFVREFVRPGLPLIIESPRHDVPWSFESVVDRCFPDARMPIAVREAAAGGRWARLDFVGSRPLSEFAEYMRAGDEAGPSDSPIYGFDLNLAHECPMLLENFAVPKYFSECALQRHYVHAANATGLDSALDRRAFLWPSMMMGEKGTRSELHYDQAGLPFWMAVLRGRKLFRMLPFAYNLPLAGDFIHPAGNWPTHRTGNGETTADLFANEILPEYFAGSSYRFEAFGPLDGDWAQAPDFEAFPRLCEAVVSEGEVGPGDYIFIPTGAPHGAVNLENTIAITSNYFSPDDDVASLAWFKRKCASTVDGGLPVPPHICAALLGPTGAVPWDERPPRTYFEMAGFADVAGWCAFQSARLAEYAPAARGAARTVRNFVAFCAAHVAPADVTGEDLRAEL